MIEWFKSIEIFLRATETSFSCPTLATNSQIWEWTLEIKLDIIPSIGASSWKSVFNRDEPLFCLDFYSLLVDELLSPPDRDTFLLLLRFSFSPMLSPASTCGVLFAVISAKLMTSMNDREWSPWCPIFAKYSDEIVIKWPCFVLHVTSLCATL